MPEIVEVKKYVDYLKNIILDKKIIEINVLKGKYKKNLIKLGDCFEMINNNLPIVIVDIFSKGKFLCFILNVSGKKMYMFNTLGLKGGWIVKNNNLNNYIKIDENENNLYEINVEKDLPNIEFMIKDDNIDFSLYFYPYQKDHPKLVEMEEYFQMGNGPLYMILSGKCSTRMWISY